MVMKKSTKKAPKKIAPVEVAKPKVKSITPEVLYDVVHGKYGCPEERNANLRAAGYAPSAVTKKLNELKKLAEEMAPIKAKAKDYYGVLLCMAAE